jgi:hypothetical protein
MSGQLHQEADREADLRAIRGSALSTSTFAACTLQDRLRIATRFASECGSMFHGSGGDHLVPAPRLAVKVAIRRRPPPIRRP